MRYTRHACLLTTGLMAAVAHAQLPNDECANAVAISCGQTVAGSTIGAAPDPNAIDCGTSISAEGIWYGIQGNGQAITLSTCINFGYDTKINVYSGICGNLVCEAGNDDGGGCAQGSTVSFVAAVGTPYLILVQGYDGGTGEFEMTVACAAPPANDDRASAVPISCNQSLDGTTVNATNDVAPECFTAIQAPGVWYTFTGVADPVLISTCESLDYDSRINVYSGSPGELVCVAGNDDTPGVGLCSTVNFVPDPSEQYFILVQGYDGETGTFMLELACQSCGTPTGVTASASDVIATAYWQSLNPGATYEIEYGPLGFTPGTGTVASGTVNAADASAVISGLAPGTEYAFYLTEVCGPADASLRTGPFTFITLPEPPPANAFCDGALPIDCGVSVEADTQGSFLQPGITCGASDITSPGLWFSLIGNGGTVTLSTCGAADFDTKISVYTGPCTAPACVAGVDDSPGCTGNTTEVTFPTTAGVQYLVLVHGYEDATGTFTLSMSCEPTCSPIAPNDACDGAIGLAISGIGLCDPVLGSNECAFATGSPNPPCDPFSSIVDVWYSFQTAGSTTLTVTLGGLTADVVNAAIYEDCGAPEYVDCSTPVNGTWSLAGLEPNTSYLLRVWNSGGTEAGSFALCVETDLTTAFEALSTKAANAIWPNPAHHDVSISGIPPGTRSLQVLDLQGRVVHAEAVQGTGRTTMPVEHLAPGSYVVRCNGVMSTMLGRFIKE